MTDQDQRTINLVDIAREVFVVVPIRGRGSAAPELAPVRGQIRDHRRQNEAPANRHDASHLPFLRVQQSRLLRHDAQPEGRESLVHFLPQAFGVLTLRYLQELWIGRW